MIARAGMQGTALPDAELAQPARANFVHVALQTTSAEIAAFELYVQDRVDEQARKGPDVLWYEVVLRESSDQRIPARFFARVTAHFRDADVSVSRNHADSLLAARGVFDLLAQRLRALRDVSESRVHARQGPRENSGGFA